jgi:hypothetical protein
MAPASSSERVDDYIASLPDGRREIVERVHEAITAAVPELEVRMWNKFIAYGSYHYVYSSGREGDWFPIGLTNNKGHVSVTTCARPMKTATWRRATPTVSARSVSARAVSA